MSPDNEALIESALRISALAAAYSEAVKKHLFHGHKWDDQDAYYIMRNMESAVKDARRAIANKEKHDA
jgi:hypothetical protein